MNTEHIYKILAAKEKRAEKQRELLSNGGILICFTLNIPGPVKLSELYRLLFVLGKQRIGEKLSENGLKPVRENEEAAYAGYEYHALLSDEKTDVLKVKSLMVSVEQSTGEGRLFDIDVLIKGEGEFPEKVSRKALGEPERTCLICGKPAFVCLRAARHTVPEVLKKAVDIILSSAKMQKMILKENCSDEVSGDEAFAGATAIRALRSLLYEVITTPKPGLVDSENNGAHKDMDITVFFDSAVSITPYFRECVLKGMELYDSQTCDILPKLRPLGIKAEEKMYSATKGVNTHKGAVFSFGVVCASCGMIYKRNPLELDYPEKILALSGEICSYMENGSEGIRTEAVNGYPSVRSALLKLYERRTACGRSEDLNLEGVRLLCYLMSQTLDSNIVRRAGLLRAEKVQREASAAEPFEKESAELIQEMAELDRRYIGENISPGGAADLLALSYFFLESD